MKNVKLNTSTLIDHQVNPYYDDIPRPLNDMSGKEFKAFTREVQEKIQPQSEIK